VAGDENVKVPGWAFQWGLGILQTISLTALVAMITWAWNTEGRVATLEAEKATLQAELASAQAELKTVTRHETEIQVLKSELRYIREGVDEVKTLMRGR
jgi:hypothetical protein